jgi:creatine kinase
MRPHHLRHKRLGLARRAERLEVENFIATGLATQTVELKGKYYALSNMIKEEEDHLQMDHCLFQKPGSGTLLTGAGARATCPADAASSTTS